MPTNLQRRILAGERDGTGGAGLAHHQSSASQRAVAISGQNRIVDRRRQPKIVSDENNFPVHICSL
jgi:hypothetical protein